MATNSSAARSSPAYAALDDYLSAPVDIASLAVFRVLFGAVLCVAALRFVAKGWVDSQLLEPRFHFTYPHLAFVRPWPATLMYVHFAVLIAAGLGLALGVRARLCASVLALGWAYIELIDRATYLNHYYLVCLLAGLLACTPAGHHLAVDSWLCPERRCATIPRWLLWVLRWQVAVVYVFAGIAKLNTDWLLHAQPLCIWLAALTGAWPWLARLQTELAFAASWLGAVFDLTLVPALLWKRTRWPALAAAVGFHAATGALLPIGMFPWIMLASVTLLLPPDWPRRLIPARPSAGAARPRSALRAALALHCAAQLLIPLYQHALAHDCAWSYEGFDFAWKVMLAEKSGNVRFILYDRNTHESWEVAPNRYLTPVQERALGQDPRLIIALARHLASELHERNGRDVAVFADAFATLNGRAQQRLIDPAVDLTRQRLPEHVIVPLQDYAMSPQ